jgi:hypothetical protein
MFLPFPGLLFSLIWTLRVLSFDPIAPFGFLTTATFAIFHGTRTFQGYRGRAFSSLTSLWLDKRFHSLLFALALIAADTYCFLFSLICCLQFGVDAAKITAKRIAPRLRGCTAALSRVCYRFMRDDGVKAVIAWLEVLLCPYLILCTVDQASVPVFMAACVAAVVYLPFMYLERKTHRSVWKSVNVWYTQVAFEWGASLPGRIMFGVLEGFREYVDAVLAMYPERFVARKLRYVEE